MLRSKDNCDRRDGLVADALPMRRQRMATARFRQGRDFAHPVTEAMAAVFGVAVGIWGLWCTVIAFIGGSLPFLGIDLDGGPISGMLALVFGGPAVVLVAALVATVVLVPLNRLIDRRRD